MYIGRYLTNGCINPSTCDQVPRISHNVKSMLERGRRTINMPESPLETSN